MEKVSLKAVKRDITGKQVKAMRRDGQLPAVIYGRHLEPIAISLEAHAATLAMSKLTSSSIITIELDGQEYPALVRERQRNFIKGNLTHIDFLAVDLKEKIRATVRLEFVGISGAVKDFNGVLVKNIEKLEVECLPTDLPERISVDIAALAQVGNSIRVRDLAISAAIRILNDEDETIAVATAAKTEASDVAAAVPGAVDAAAAPGLSVERGKKEEEAKK
jgi:large subunit ribosomal protein L25